MTYSKLAMYAMGTGTWYETDGTAYQNMNIIGLTDTADLVEPDADNSGAMAFGTAAIAAVAALMAF